MKALIHFCNEHKLKWRAYPKRNQFEFRRRSRYQLLAASA